MPEEIKKKFRKSIEAKSLSHDVNILSNTNKQLFVKKKRTKIIKKKTYDVTSRRVFGAF